MIAKRHVWTRAECDRLLVPSRIMLGVGSSLWCAHFKCEVQNRLGKLQHKGVVTCISTDVARKMVDWYVTYKTPWNGLLFWTNQYSGREYSFLLFESIWSIPLENWHITWKIMLGRWFMSFWNGPFEKDVSFNFRVVLGLENRSERHDTQEFEVFGEKFCKWCVPTIWVPKYPETDIWHLKRCNFERELFVSHPFSGG